MKKIYPIIALLLSCLFFAACGGQKDKQDSGENTWRGIQAGMDDLSAITDRIEYYDIVVESDPIFQWEFKKDDSSLLSSRPKFVSMQFYQGEPVQLWLVPNRGKHDICLYRQDGSQEVILQGFDTLHEYHAYLDQEGNLYWWRDSSKWTYSDGHVVTHNAFLKKYLPSGEVLFDNELGSGLTILNIRQAADGRVYLIIRVEKADGIDSIWLAELDPATGLITEQLDNGQLAKNVRTDLALGIHGDIPAIFNISKNMIKESNTGDWTESCFLSFRGTTYVSPKNYPDLHDFRILDDESVEILWAARDSNKSLQETLQMAKVEKIPIIVRCSDAGTWLSNQANSFNQSSETYHVILETCGPGNDINEFARLTSIQLASGKGPDIVYGNLMQDYIAGMLEKGAIEDLRPYIERNGVREEDYFPFTFNVWGYNDKIYGITPTLSPTGYLMDSAVLGGAEEPDIETLVDALLARYAKQAGQEDAAFLKGYGSQKLLTFLLKGTDTLWGMVDWEKGRCDFSGELFAKILETAKQYGDNSDSKEKTYIAKARTYGFIFLFEDISDREKEGKVICGVLFDDGCHTAFASRTTLAVNANSSNKEGAWEFISFLLEDEAQSQAVTGNTPASRKAFDLWVTEQKNQVADGREIYMASIDGSGGITTYSEDDITNAIVGEYIETIEDARPYPIRTAPILDIISEEAASYFNGSKSAAEVGRIVANRVQTYLDEGH